jgi:hypothetical protein
MATMKMDDGGKSPKKTATKKMQTVQVLKKKVTSYPRPSGDTTKVKSSEKMSSGGDKPQYPKLMLKKSSKKMM